MHCSSLSELSSVANLLLFYDLDPSTGVTVPKTAQLFLLLETNTKCTIDTGEGCFFASLQAEFSESCFSPEANGEPKGDGQHRGHMCMQIPAPTHTQVTNISVVEFSQSLSHQK